MPGDTIVFEVASSQWVARPITSVAEIAVATVIQGWRFGLGTATATADGDNLDVSATAVQRVRFYISSAARGQPTGLKGQAVYETRQRTKYNLRNATGGYFNFYATAPAANNSATTFGDAIKNATILEINEDDDQDNLFDSLEAVEAGHFIMFELREHGIWAAWQVTSINKRFTNLYSIIIRLYSYKVDRTGSAPWPPNADVDVWVTPLVPTSGLTLDLRADEEGVYSLERNRWEVHEGETLLEYGASMDGTALEGKAADDVTTAASLLIHEVRDGAKPIKLFHLIGRTPTTNGFSITPPLVNADVDSIAGTLNLPASITNDWRLTLDMTVKIGTIFRRDTSRFRLVATKLQQLPLLVSSAVTQGLKIRITRGAIDATADTWEYRLTVGQNTPTITSLSRKTAQVLTKELTMGATYTPVSYTHLTLPTIYSV